MLGSSEVVAFVPASDLVHSRRFYENTLGLRLVADDSPIACVFDANGTMLRITAVPEVVGASYTVLGWAVIDVSRTVESLVERKVASLRFDGLVQDDLGIWTAPSGDRIAWFSDPASNTLSLTQFQHSADS
jgi:catechol 2,3-dioxygenase-like lactoylglutathione lyase family enzyme